MEVCPPRYRSGALPACGKLLNEETRGCRTDREHEPENMEHGERRPLAAVGDEVLRIRQLDSIYTSGPLTARTPDEPRNVEHQRRL